VSRLQVSDYYSLTQFIVSLFQPLTDFFTPLGIPFGPIAWFYILTTGPLFIIAVVLAVRRRKGAGGSGVDEGIRKIIASTGDVTGGMAGAKKLKFIKTPADALIFLKIEENAIQQALSAVDYYSQQGNLEEYLKTKIADVYENRLAAVRDAIAKDEELKEIVDTSTAVDRARSDYLKKLAAMSGTAVEAEEGESGPTSVGTPGKVSKAPSGGAPSGAAPAAGPPGGGPPGGGPPSGGPPSGGPPSGAAPAAAPPSSTAPAAAPPSSGPPGGAAPAAASPPGGVAPAAASPPGGAVPTADDSPRPSGGKSSLQSEMLAEMERLKALMGGD
jgi:hypothetical protein